MKNIFYAILLLILLGAGVAQAELDDGPGNRLGVGDRELVPLPEHVTLPDHVTSPTRPRPSAPSEDDWQEDFMKDFDKFGIDDAVENALDKGISANEILTLIVSNQEKFQTRMSLQALYCGGADRKAVREAANKLGITVAEVSVSLEESIAECGSKLALDDRDLMDEPASSPDSGASSSSLPDSQIFSKLIENPTSPGNPSSPSQP
jgi:hypothetical protein